MSTQFTARSTDQWAFTRWAGPGARETPKRSTFDFGADPSRVIKVKEAFDAGEIFDGEDGTTITWDEIAAGVWTFGEFGGTFAVGSGDIAEFEGI